MDDLIQNINMNQKYFNKSVKQNILNEKVSDFLEVFFSGTIILNQVDE